MISKLRLAVALPLVLVLLAAPLAAATFSTNAIIPGCSDPVANSVLTKASSECVGPSVGALQSGARAKAGGGVVSASAFSISQRNDDGVGRFTGPAQASALISDTIRIDGGIGGSVLFPLDVYGSTSFGLTSDDGAFTLISAGFQVNGATYYSDSIGGSSLIDGVFAASVPNVDGVLRILTGAQARARACTIVDRGETCFAEAEFGGSLRMLGISVFDADGRDITNSVTVTSDSGFDYVKGAEPHDRAAVVPLPASVLLLLSALALLGLRRSPAGT